MAGIACAGHWVLDSIKFIDYWPEQAELCNISSNQVCNGGAPFNVIVDLANLKVPFPTYGIGCIGKDVKGDKILQMCKKRGINIEHLQILDQHATSFTDVMTLSSSGVRTMFHFRGANDHFGPEHVPINELKQNGVKLFYLGHLLLMAKLEEPDTQHGNLAGKLLHDVQNAGIETVLDIATESANRYQRVVVPVLPYVDHLIINELEAGHTAGFDVRNRDHNLILDGVKKSAQFLKAQGVKKNVIIHMPEGALWLDEKGSELFFPSFNIPKQQFIATCGAGDAFCAGVCVGLHEGWSREETLRLAKATAAMSITSKHNSDGIRPIEETLKITESWR